MLSLVFCEILLTYKKENSKIHNVNRFYIMYFTIFFGGIYMVKSFDELMNEKVLLVVVNKTVAEQSTKEQIEWATLGDWKVDLRKLPDIEYVIGIKDQIGVSCFKINNYTISPKTRRVRFISEIDLSNLVIGVNFSDIRKGHGAIQYINHQ